MWILVTGSNGFIGTKIVFELISRGFNVICCGRNQQRNLNSQTVKYISADFSRQIPITEWTEKLAEITTIDIIINCVGALNGSKEAMWNIHYHNPKALITAAAEKQLKKVVQISAHGIDEVNNSFANSKKALDNYLLTLVLPVIVVRPSLVYASGSYGGTSLFRGMAGLPGTIPVPGRGNQKFQPIHIDDLTSAIIKLLDVNINNQILIAAGPKQYTLFEIIMIIRKWLGFNGAVKISVPIFIIKGMAKIGSIVGATFNSTMFNMLQKNNIATQEEANTFQKIIHFIPRDFQHGIFHEPSYVQDRWHARLYFLKPLLRLSIAMLWIFTAITVLFLYPETKSIALLQNMGIQNYHHALFLLYGAGITDFVLGLATLFNYHLKWVGSLQILLISAYTLIISIWLPHLWLEPFAPIAKNIPIVVATAIMIALEAKR